MFLAALIALTPGMPVSAEIAEKSTPPGANCQQPAADWIFCEDFESGTLKQWDRGDPPKKGSLDVVTQPGPGGVANNHALQLRVNPGRGGAALNKTFTPDQYRRLYARWYQQYEPGFDLSAANHGHGLHAGDRWKRGRSGKRPRGDDYFTVQMEYLPAEGRQPARPYIYSYYRGMSMDCRDPNGQCWGDHIPCMVEPRYCRKRPETRPTLMPPALETGRWYCVELMVEAGDAVADSSLANGITNFWIDDVAYGPWGNLWFRSDEKVKLNHFWLGLFHHRDHSEQGILYDNVVVSRSRVGCN